MIARSLLRQCIKIYKRNSLLSVASFFRFSSTEHYNNKMEGTNELAAKVEQVTITGMISLNEEQKVEQPPAAETVEVKPEGKKEKKPKAEKPKAEKKEEPAEDKD